MVPGCKIGLERFEQVQLGLISKLSFVAVGLILASILAAVVCSNHVNRYASKNCENATDESTDSLTSSARLFGKGLPPRSYRSRPIHREIRANAS